MRLLTAACQGAGKLFPRHLLTVGLLLSLGAPGCNNTCVGFASNASTGTIVIKVVDQKPACTLSSANGAVRVHLSGSGTGNGGFARWGVQHIFVSIRGIEARQDIVHAEGSPDWQELTPELVRQPRQIDLMASAGGNCASDSLGEGNVEAGVYRQIRLRLVPNQAGLSELLPPDNACGGVGWNCAVAADGGIRPLALDSAAPELLIGAEAIAGGFVPVLPDTGTDLSIEFSAPLSLALPAGSALRLVPAFAVALGSPCPSAGGFEP